MFLHSSFRIDWKYKFDLSFWQLHSTIVLKPPSPQIESGENKDWIQTSCVLVYSQSGRGTKSEILFIVAFG